MQTMLGHATLQTTMVVYLEPFRALDVQLLLEHAAIDLTDESLLALLRNHPRVMSAAEVIRGTQ